MTNDLTLKQAENEHAGLAVIINEYNRLYYQEDAPGISDAEYDLLFQRLLELEEIFPECEKRGIGIIIGSPYASGILATGSCEESKYGYTNVSEQMRNKVQSIEKICEVHRIPIKAAALKFPLAHPLVSSVIPGSLSAAQVLDNIEMLKCPIPSEFWIELKQAGLLHPEAPVK